MVLTRFLSCLLAAAALVPAQDSMWVANRFSSDLSKVDLCGAVTATVNIGTSLSRVRQAPDGRLWVIKFIQPTFDIRNPDGTLFTTITSTVGSPVDVAFDRNGHAWLTGNGIAVQEYDANGIPLATYPLPASAALGITVDADGNKWIAHRIGPPGSVSRIDGTTGAVTNHAAPSGSNIQPVAVVADFRGVGTSSHVWVVGDGGTTVDEYDNLGNPRTAYPVGAGLTTIDSDLAGAIWCGSFTSGSIFKLDPATGSTLLSFTAPPSVLGVSFDSFGRLWVTVRVTFSGPQPSEVRRFDPLTGALEVPAIVGLGTGTELSTRVHYAMVVDPVSDADGDGDLNISELVAGTSPYDAQSTSSTSLVTRGSSAQGAIAILSLSTQPGNLSFIAAATALVSPGLPFPAVTGLLLLDPFTLVLDPVAGGYFLIPANGPLTFGILIPIPGPVGFVLHIQAVTNSPAVSQLSNATCLKIY